MLPFPRLCVSLSKKDGKEYVDCGDAADGGVLYTDYSTDSLTIIKKNGKHMFSYPGREMIVSMHVDSIGVQKIYRSGEVYDMPKCYTVMGTNPLAMVDGILHVGMTSVDGSGPAVWQDEEIKRLGFNGYISSISVWNP